MSRPPSAGSPISRRLMAALFVLMIVPVSGWYFLGELTSRELLAELPGGAGRALEAVQDEIRFKLALTLGASVVVLGAVLFYLRRSVIDPLGRLARRARAAECEGWRTSEESGRPDEIDDLARALDRSIPAMEQRAEEALRYAANLSHELRTPLAAIRGAAEILAEGRPASEDRQRFVANILTESERLERLVVGLLDLERGAAAEAATVEPLEAGPVIANVVERCSPLFERKLLGVGVEQADGLPPVRIDRTRLERILFGLLENAIRFSPQGGSITVRTRAGDAELLVDVEDEGPGVPPELRDAIFERHFTGGRGQAGGTGIGLAIVGSLVGAAGGRVRVDEAPGGGARFRCALPAARVPVGAEPIG